MSMPLIILTRGRVGKQLTFSNLTAALRRRTIIICPEKEQRSHTLNHPQVAAVITQPNHDWLVYEKRRWIMEHFHKKGEERLVMMDDDLRFCQRRTDDPKKFTTATPEQTEQAFAELEKHLTPDIPHASFAARGGSISPKAQLGGWQEAKRPMYVLGFHVPTVMREIDPFRIETREDLDTSLQLLMKGYPNVVNYTFCSDQKFGAPGGASLERDFGRANRDAETLARSFPGIVKVVKKDDVGRGISEEARTRFEVVVQWEKALQLGKQWRAAQAGGSQGGRGRAGARPVGKNSRR